MVHGNMRSSPTARWYYSLKTITGAPCMVSFVALPQPFLPPLQRHQQGKHKGEQFICHGCVATLPRPPEHH
eukprot:32079-Eustigmatos_ZCMA.PRE.1